ncbi:hypothetical protein K458DRAFT_437910 [Lentithecium fluviatile CBS 122367]|uniref:Protein kinase domain-containing protein n=1 Tax=Lentithecium fluviatile CBS 122367 TaxID=1168545 RepID=A0A6G1JMR2_9PLEO|nr:hypothetical protein K458DRAFT_437910 [Lentithecium fluviatile CBS 122367]
MKVHRSLQGSLYDLPILSCGVSGVVFGLPDSAVVKVPRGSDQSREELAIESSIYNRLGSHPYITKATPPKDVLRWAIQISQALQYAHSRYVFQSEDATGKLSDFAGSSIDGSAPSVLPSPHSEHPNMPKSSIQSEMFALGSTLYEVDTAQQLYHDKSDKDIHELFRAGDFPDMSALMLGEVISKCWRVEYKDLGEAVNDITRIQSKYVTAVE